jgi:tRNA threonylcarbamoyladenosine biosynthesis protein TsaE
MKTAITFGLDELEKVAEKIIATYPDDRIFYFKGELGAGKTTLIKSLCNKLGVREGLSSPTFSIINEYETADNKIIYHADLYRLKNIDEAKAIGLDEYLDSGNYCFIEWPELIESYFEGVSIEISKVNEMSRKLVSFKTRV